MGDDAALVGEGFRSPVREPLEKVRGSISIQSYSQIDWGLRSRAAQNFWEIIPQTPNWKLAQNVKVYQVSSQSKDVLTRPQSHEDASQRPSLQVSRYRSSNQYSGLCGHGKKSWD